METTLQPGQAVTWLHQPHGGYGYTYPVDATVSKVTKHRITLRVPTRSGRIVTRSVRAEHIRIPDRQLENTL